MRHEVIECGDGYIEWRIVNGGIGSESPFCQRWVERRTREEEVGDVVEGEGK
jgi:hypothetical protein